eukprot:TRINITY_DN454_c2_g1_i1.p1 TRINITY_DN454_c2_g1~~TRINITY_DN454_c2_g1_i1.p1  ORF type:complete len:443 (-),score=122.29 TRINITY_DN454_c2_g1_i1:149-1477(-)
MPISSNSEIRHHGGGEVKDILYKKKEEVKEMMEKKDKEELKKKPYRPFIVGILGDNLTVFISIIALLFAGPLVGILIFTATVSMIFLEKIWEKLTFLHFIPKGVDSISKKLGQVVLNDPRNYQYLPYILWLCVWPLGLFIYAFYRNETQGFEWWFLVLYHYLRIGPRFRFFAHLHVLLHKEGHDYKGFFKGPLSVFNHWLVQWYCGSLFGQVPNSYRVAHNKIHHRYDNGLNDVHTNLDLDRTKFWSFLLYLPRFALYWTGVSPLVCFYKRKEIRLRNKIAYGMCLYYGIFVILSIFNWKFALFYFLFPQFESIIFFAGISYVWHLWVEAEDPDNEHINSVTIIRGKDNIWNEDYHVIHHDAPQVHWTDAPQYFEDHKEDYAKCNATIFADCEEGQLLFWCLAGKWDELAEHFVDLNDKMTHEEKKELLIRRASTILDMKQQ